MKIIKIFLSSTFLILISLFSVFASAPANLVITDVGPNYVDLSWDKVEGAEGYKIYYSTTPANDGVYDFKFGDIVEGNNGTLDRLDPDTKYYLSVTSVDSELVESGYSEELSFDTTDGFADGFKLKSIDVLGFSKIKLNFNLDLEEGEDVSREFRIINNDDFLDELIVLSAELDEESKSSLILELDPLPTLDTEYELTVIDIQSSDGSTIESGVDGSDTFTVSSDSDFSNKEENTSEETSDIEQQDSNDETEQESTEPEISQEEQNAEFEAAGTESGSIAGQNVEGVENVETAANENDKLPNTGPEIFILILIALFLGIGFFQFRKS